MRGTPRRPRHVAAIVLLAISSLAGCSWGKGGTATPITTPATTTLPLNSHGLLDVFPSGKGPLVAILGDSLTVSVLGDLRSALTGHSVVIAAWKGEGWSGGPFSKTIDIPSILLHQVPAFASMHPETAVFALGTNDSWNPDLDIDLALANIDKTAKAFAGSCIVAVTVRTSVPEQPAYDPDRARRINARLRADADAVVPWDRISDRPGLLAADGIHLTDEGRRVWTDEIVDAVRTCHRR